VAFWQYLHNMIGSVVTASFVMASVGAFYLLTRRHEDFGRTFVRLGVIAGTIATFLMVFPTGDGQGQEHRLSSAADAGRHGGPVRNGKRRAAGDPRAAGRGPKRRLDNPSSCRAR
jgi:hypothetical protein